MRVQAADPLQTAGQFLTLRNLGQQGQLLKQRELDLKRNRELAEAKALRDQRSAELDQQLKQFDLADKQQKRSAQVFGTMKDPVSFTRGIGILLSSGDLNAEEAQQFLQQGWSTQMQETAQQLATMAIDNVQQLQEGYRALEEERKAAAEGRAIVKHEADVAQTTAQTVAVGQPKGSLREFKESYYPGWLAERGLERSAANEKKALEEFRRPQRAPVPGVDAPLPPDVEAQKARISQAGRQPARPNLRYEPYKGGLSPEEFQRIGAISDDARQDKDIKIFTDVRDSYQRIQSAAKRGDGVGDLTLMRSFAKLTDPTTGVREEEYRTMQVAIGELRRLGVKITEGMVTGKQLTQAGRKAFLDQARDLYEGHERNYTKASEHYRERARRAGVDPEAVIPRIVAEPAEQDKAKDPLGVR